MQDLTIFSDNKLIEMYQSTNKQAYFNTLFDRYHLLEKKYILSHDDVLDAESNFNFTFYKCVKHFKLNRCVKFSTYLINAIKNLDYSLYKSLEKYNYIQLDDEMDDRIPELGYEEDFLYKNKVDKIILKYIDRFSNNKSIYKTVDSNLLKKILIDCIIMELSYVDISKKYKVSTTTVMNYKKRFHKYTNHNTVRGAILCEI